MSDALAPLKDAKTILLTTYKRDGTAVGTPVSIACEMAVLDALGDRAAIARVGLIGGPGDRTDRSGYWPARFELAGNGPVLVPAHSGPAHRLHRPARSARWLVRAAVLATAESSRYGARCGPSAS